MKERDFPGGPVVKTSPSNARMQVWSLTGEIRSHMPQGQKPKTYNRSNIVTNSIKTFKMVHIKKKKIFKKMKEKYFLRQTKTKIEGIWGQWSSLGAQIVKNLPAMQETWVLPLGWEDPLEKRMSTRSSICAWRIPWTEEPGRLQSMGSQRVGHDWATFTLRPIDLPCKNCF